MRFNIVGRNIDVTEGLKDAVEEKLGKLEKYFRPDTQINVTLSVEKDSQKIEVTIPMKGNIIRSEQESTDMYVSIDLVEEIIERQLRKYKTKLTASYKGAVSISDFAESYIEEDFEEPDEIRIERTKRFAVKPMDPEEACMQMELLGHTFFVFRNADSEEINVVYKRKNGTYGLIEPEF
ncbi:MAG: ribosome-associated translation inhibitor RaiA [Lachnospiraceae bacterium]|nr:ribosome-associated translation inhibitor RaiA [Lachnospiraceae bacterium]MDY4970808.1 ribosome-associated translation inhibitor RaiA [Lachnospiraceae bacterium]